jgi:hypothetical protein
VDKGAAAGFLACHYTFLHRGLAYTLPLLPREAKRKTNMKKPPGRIAGRLLFWSTIALD